MGTVTLELPADGQPESFGSNLAGMLSFLIDPNSAARRLFTKWFWLFPLMFYIVVSVVGSILVTPIVEHVLEIQPVPDGVSPEVYQRNMQFGMKIQRFAGAVVPVISMALEALLLWGMASIVSLQARFRQMFNLAAGCSIISALSALAGVVILKAKGEISSMAELRPALGLDIFMPEGSNKFLMAFFGYFSLFEIWWIVMMVLVLSAAYRVSKGKALTVIGPLVLLSLGFRLVMAALQRT